jgi:hypothetical protein
LQGLKKTSSQQSLAKGTLEALGIRRFAQGQFVKMVGLYFVELFNNGWVIDRQAAELSKTLGGFLVLVHLDEVSWSFWEDEKAASMISLRLK